MSRKLALFSEKGRKLSQETNHYIDREGQSSTDKAGLKTT
jgi:hypothetical protein